MLATFLKRWNLLFICGGLLCPDAKAASDPKPQPTGDKPKAPPDPFVPPPGKLALTSSSAYVCITPCPALAIFVCIISTLFAIFNKNIGSIFNRC